MRAVTPHARAISSMTRITSSTGRSPPPYSRGIVIPMNPAATSSFTLSHGYSSRSSQRAARSANTRSASSRAFALSSCCSFVSSKSMALEVNGLAERGERRLERGLGQRRVRVDRVDDLLERRLERAAHRELVDDLRRFGPEDVDAEDLARRLVGDDLHEPVGLAECDRLAVRGERELAHGDRAPVLLRLRLADPARRDLRAAARARR